MFKYVVTLALLFSTAAFACPPGQDSVQEIVEYVQSKNVPVGTIVGDKAVNFFNALQKEFGPAPESYRGADSFLVSFPTGEDGEQGVNVGFVKDGCVFNILPMDFKVFMKITHSKGPSI